MCGIAGFMACEAIEPLSSSKLISNMTAALSHRGPDDSGHWMNAAAGIVFGHRRLSILDLSAAGHQPMQSGSGRFTVVFNGEIYNHLELRRSLTSTPWRGHSDTETLVAGFEQWGVNGTLERAVGMFALAVWDRDERVLYLGRDRIGEKPLYYGWQGKTLLFASELKALFAHPAFQGVIDRAALSSYVRHGYVPAPHSMFAGIRKLPPGSVLKLRNLHTGDSGEINRFWSLASAVRAAKFQSFKGTADEAVATLEELLSTAITGQQLADVPVGAFLSGGTDSSVVVALMQSRSPRPVRTFTIGFDEKSHNEAIHAKAVAAHLGTEHTELYVSPTQALELVPRIAQIYDEPFADMSQIPTLLVSRMARSSVTVALSGDGGDELFGGYGRYAVTNRQWQQLSRIPRSVRRTLLFFAPALLQEALRADTLEEFYSYINSQWKSHPRLVLNGALGVHSGATSDPSLRDLLDPRERMMFMDTLDYLPNDILVKVDRAAMSTSLETRIPLLDHRVVEFCWHLPMSIKAKDGVEKWALKQILYKHVPRALVERPKMGFATPMGEWLRGPLRSWAEALLSRDRLKRESFFDADAVSAEWQVHLSGRRDRQYGLWTVLMFQAWYDSLKERATLRDAA